MKAARFVITFADGRWNYSLRGGEGMDRTELALLIHAATWHVAKNPADLARFLGADFARFAAGLYEKFRGKVKGEDFELPPAGGVN